MNTAEKQMEVCGWSTEPVSTVVVRVRCASSVNGKAALPKNRAKSVSSCIRSQLGMSHFSGETGVGEFTGVPVSNSSVTNAWRSRRSLFTLPYQLSRLRLFPVQSGHTFGFPGNVGWLGMSVPLRRNG